MTKFLLKTIEQVTNSKITSQSRPISAQKCPRVSLIVPLEYFASYSAPSPRPVHPWIV